MRAYVEHTVRIGGDGTGDLVLNELPDHHHIAVEIIVARLDATATIEHRTTIHVTGATPGSVAIVHTFDAEQAVASAT